MTGGAGVEQIEDEDGLLDVCVQLLVELEVTCELVDEIFDEELELVAVGVQTDFVDDGFIPNIFFASSKNDGFVSTIVKSNTEIMARHKSKAPFILLITSLN
jgi:regulator of RNase E activity RraB